MRPETAGALFATARVARLGTIDADGRPHLVPITFAVEGDTVVTAVDAKPKRTRELRRLENIRRDGRVTLLVDEYDDADWNRLWWVRADGTARVLDAPAPAMLIERYAQYRVNPPLGPIIAVAVERWIGWRACAVAGT